jgi:hypothetical protein
VIITLNNYSIVSNITRIDIIGKGEGREYAPQKATENGELWAVNNSIFDRDVDRLFYLHYPEDTAEWEEMKVRAYELDIPIMMQDSYPEIDKSTRYPLREIIEKFGTYYFSNSIAYMLAYALYIGVKEVHIWGVPLNFDTEYIYEKASVEFWIGYCMASGVRIILHDNGSGTVMKTADWKLYGFCKLIGGIVKDWKTLVKKRDLLRFTKPKFDDGDS